MSVATDKRKVSAYLDEDVKDKADRLAKLESRSLSSLIEVLLKEAIRKAEEDGRL
jgi:hypothetical protein